ncbi:MAG TPA: TPM domain-containing protein [Myxococcales bacterium]|jgi:uncharacterized protein
MPRPPPSLGPPAGRIAALLLALSACIPVGPPRSSIPPTPTAWVTDRAGVLSPGKREALDHKLEFFERKTGHQIIVFIDRSIGPAPLEEWAARTFQAWGVGRKGLDDGAVLFVLADDHKARIEVGYGLEDRIPDAVASRIIDEALIPGMRSGDPDAALGAAVDRLVAAASGTPQEPGPPVSSTATGSRPGAPGAPGAAQLIFLVVVGFALLVLFATHPTLALWLLFNLASGGRGGGGRSGRGGFSGGGGRSGGGGASGSW